MADVQLAADEPFHVRHLALQHLVPRLEPHEFVLRLARPEFFRRLDGLGVELAVVRERLDVRALGKIFGRRKHARLVGERGDVHRVLIGHRAASLGSDGEASTLIQESERHEKKSKSQNSNPKQIPKKLSSKPQSRSRACLEFAIWSLFGIWDLEFGVSAQRHPAH